MCVCMFVLFVHIRIYVDVAHVRWVKILCVAVFVWYFASMRLCTICECLCNMNMHVAWKFIHRRIDYTANSELCTFMYVLIQFLTFHIILFYFKQRYHSIVLSLILLLLITTCYYLCRWCHCLFRFISVLSILVRYSFW